jgi:hypothetical protein
MNVTSATAAVTAAHVVTIRGASKMMWVGMSFEGVQQFAKVVDRNAFCVHHGHYIIFLFYLCIMPFMGI